MNLSTIDLGTTGSNASPAALNPPPAGNEPTSPSTTGFGQLMTQAFRRMGQPGQDGEPTAPEALADGSVPTADGDTTWAQGLDASVLPAWMQSWPQGLAVQPVNPGTGLQVITTSAPGPDSVSLAAFAKAQGMDPHAIALLLGQDSTAATGAPGSASTAAASSIGLDIGATPGLQASSPVAGVPSAFALATAAGIAPTPAEASDAVAQLASAPGPQNPTVSSSMPAQPGAASLALASSWISSVTAWQDTPGHSSSQAAPAPTETLVDPANSLLMAHLRWAQPIGGKGGATRAPDASTFAPTAQTEWAESELDLSDLMASDTGLTASQTAARTAAGTDPQPAAQSGGAPVDGSAQLRLPGHAAMRSEGSHTPAAPHSTAASDQMQQLSEQMADAIGQRMIREIERGHWSLRLMLKPAQLGHIEVEMRLRAGELDASFTAPQGTTRDLLQDGLSRLKETLNQMGMDVANLDVRNGQNRQNGGDPTPGQGQTAQSPLNKENAEITPPTRGSAPRPRRPDGWDVLV